MPSDLVPGLARAHKRGPSMNVSVSTCSTALGRCLPIWGGRDWNLPRQQAVAWWEKPSLDVSSVTICEPSFQTDVDET
jgi:hypothetical protein